jgi:ABC-type branched-subunit amino acid transport system substrate-binding protein
MEASVSSAAARSSAGPAAAAPAASVAVSPTALEAEGKRIYRTGAGGAGPEITALIGGEGGTEVGAAALPCAGCHGLDGRGRPEGGVVPSDLTWEALTRPYAAGPNGGRRHPPYDERTLKRAITLGIDAGGAPLQPAMPRYRLAQEQAAALIAYLRRLGNEIDPGVAADRLRLGVLLPPGPESEEVRRRLDAFAARLAAAGGIYGRSLELRYLEAEPPPPEPLPPEAPAPPPPEAAAAARRAAVERFLAGSQVFALVASAFAGAERELAGLAAEQELPVVGALTASPPAGSPLNRYVFYLQPGLAEQARALVEAAAASLGGAAGRLGLLLPRAAARSTPAESPPRAGGPGGDLEAASAAARFQCDRLGLQPWAASYAPAGAPSGDRGQKGPGAGSDLEHVVAAASRAGVEALVLLGGEAEARELLTRADALGWHPRVYLLAALAVPAVVDAPAAFAGRLYLAAPGLPSDLTPQGLELLRPAAAPPGRPSSPSGPSGPTAAPAPAAAPPPADRPTPYERAAVAALETLREALTRCGREIGRERLIAALEELRDFQTGLAPPLTFGPDRRIGALGAYLVTYDPRQGTLAPAGGWVTPR